MDEVINKNSEKKELDKKTFSPIEAYKDLIFIQTSFMYSGSDGSRRVRIENYYVNLTSNPSLILVNINQINLFSHCFRLFVFELYNSYNFVLNRGNILNNIDEVYKLNNSIMKKGFLNPSISNFHNYYLAFLKNDIAKLCTKLDIDWFNYLRHLILKEKAESIINIVYCEIYAFDTASLKFEIKLDNCTYEALQNSQFEIFLIIEYSYFILYIKTDTRIEILKKVFNCDHIDKVLNDFLPDNIDENELSLRTESLSSIFDFILIKRNETIGHKKLFAFDSPENNRILNILTDSNYSNEYFITADDYLKKLLS